MSFAVKTMSGFHGFESAKYGLIAISIFSVAARAIRCEGLNVADCVATPIVGAVARSRKPLFV